MRTNLLTIAAVLTVLLLAPEPNEARVVAIGVAKSTSAVYAWHDDGKATSGTHFDFEAHRKAYAYAMPSGLTPQNISAIAIGSGDKVYSWYDNGTFSIGTSSDLDAYASTSSYTLPVGKYPEDIVGMAINSEDRVYTWYKSGHVSVGTPTALGSIQGPLSVILPPGLYMNEVVEMDINSSERVVTWFRDGRYTIGQSRSLQSYQGPQGYRSARIIARYWGVGRADKALLDSAAASALATPSVGDAPDAPVEPPSAEAMRLFDDKIELAKATSPSPNKMFLAATGGSKDPMIAAGHNFLIVSDTSSLRFLDRDGKLLDQKYGLPTEVSTTDFFGGFLRKTEPDNSYNYTNINNFLGYRDRCDSSAFPDTNGDGFCINSFYDTRVHYDATLRRFFIISNSRHPVWENVTDTTCIQYVPPSGGDDRVDSDEYCDSPRRLIALAVSRTEDPREGFHQYMFTDNIYRDFPWMTVNGDRVVIGGVGKQTNDAVTPVAVVLDKSDLSIGVAHPAYSHYFRDDLFGSIRAIPVRHFGSSAGWTFLLDGHDNILKIHGIPAGSSAWDKGAAKTQTLILNNGLSNMPAATYRNGFLYYTTTVTAESLGSASRSSVLLTRIPLDTALIGFAASTSAADGYIEEYFGLNASGDSPGDRISYEKPSIAVNSIGDMLFGYGRYPFVTENVFYPEARYSLRRGSTLDLERSALLQAGNASCDKSISTGVDYTTVDVDPVDGKSFWMALPFCSSSDNYQTVIGRVTP